MTVIGEASEAVVSQPIADLEGEGFVGEFPEGSRLIGTRCSNCGNTMIGSRVVCSTCVSQDVERIALPATGELYSFTRLHPGADAVRPIGYIDLDNDVRTLTDIRETVPLRPGLRMEFGVDADGWFFTPVTGV